MAIFRGKIAHSLPYSKAVRFMLSKEEKLQEGHVKSDISYKKGNSNKA
jgi:hypothetical protein